MIDAVVVKAVERLLCDNRGVLRLGLGARLVVGGLTLSQSQIGAHIAKANMPVPVSLRHNRRG